MANTYLKIYLHVIFAVKYHRTLIPTFTLPSLHRYISAFLTNNGQKAIAVGGINDHVHALFVYDGRRLISDIMRELKSQTSKVLNQKGISPYRFEWQRGYACFSVSQSQVETVTKYILNQHEHHRNRTIESEITALMEKYQIDFDARYILQCPEE